MQAESVTTMLNRAEIATARAAMIIAARNSRIEP